MTKYTLLTGSTGLVGRYLMRDMLLTGHNLALIVRPSRRESAPERIETICQMWEREIGKPLPRPIVLSGDISQPGLGFSDDDKAWIAKHCYRIIHSAAILEFFGKDREREPWRTNLGGTQNVLDLCRETGLDEMHYISTAYVAGLQEGRVMEEGLDRGQTFRNDYEESKFEAERLVREADFLDRPTIYRPAVIAGDYNTGYTNTYHGIYLYLRLLAMIVPEIPVDENGKHPTPIKLNMTGREKRNIIPVDWVSAVTARLLEIPETRGMTFHIAPEDPMTSGDIIEYCSEYFNTTGYEYCGDDPNFEGDEQAAEFANSLISNITTYEAYERTDNLFDLTNLKQFVPDLMAPKIDKTVMFRYLDFGEADKWGKARGPKTEVAFSVADYLARAAQETASTDSEIGLDVSGPGGGQWAVAFSGSSIARVSRGLPVEDLPVLRLTVDDFAQACQDVGSLSDEGLWHGSANARVCEQAMQALFPLSLAAADDQ